MGKPYQVFGRVISYKQKELGEKAPDVRVWGTALYKLVSYITLAWKRLPKTNTAAYWDHSQDTNKIKWCECGLWLFFEIAPSNANVNVT